MASAVSVDDRPLAVDARRLVKLYGPVPALIEVDLALEAGAVCAVVGPNGAGKTTLLRILATATRPTSGTARVFGADAVADADRVRTLLDVLPADGSVYPELTARENLRFACRMRGLSADDVTLEEALEWAGLGEAVDMLARSFSTGMLRRLGLARLRLSRPALLLLDEPYAAIDEEGQMLVDELLLEARGEERAAVLATHDRERALGVADRLLELRRGVAVPEGEPAPVGSPHRS